jgi:hypothetical protein
MAPGLLPGDGLVATAWWPARPGQVRCALHPGRPGFWLVKRVWSVQGGRMTLVSDNPEGVQVAGVPVEGSYLVLLRVRGGRVSMLR